MPQPQKCEKCDYEGIHVYRLGNKMLCDCNKCHTPQNEKSHQPKPDNKDWKISEESWNNPNFVGYIPPDFKPKPEVKCGHKNKQYIPNGGSGWYRCRNCKTDLKPSPASTEEWTKLTDQMSKLGVDEWIKQGRSEEQIYGVKNFLTGLGGKKIQELVSSHDQQLRQRIVEGINDYHAKQLTLYRGKLPFTVLNGKADEKEKITIYEHALQELLTFITNLK